MTPEQALEIGVRAMMRAFIEPTAEKPRAKKPRGFVKRGTNSKQLRLDEMPDFPVMPRMDLPFTPSPLANDIPPVTAEELAAIENALNRDPDQAPPGMFYKEQAESPMRAFGMEE